MLIPALALSGCSLAERLANGAIAEPNGAVVEPNGVVIEPNGQAIDPYGQAVIPAATPASSPIETTLTGLSQAQAVREAVRRLAR